MVEICQDAGPSSLILHHNHNQPYLRLQNAPVASQLLKVRVVHVDQNCRSTQIVLGKSCAVQPFRVKVILILQNWSEGKSEADQTT